MAYVVMIQSNALFSEFTIALFDVNRRLLYSESSVANSSRLQLDISSLSSGVYFLQINSEEKIITIISKLFKWLRPMQR